MKLILFAALAVVMMTSAHAQAAKLGCVAFESEEVIRGLELDKNNSTVEQIAPLAPKSYLLISKVEKVDGEWKLSGNVVNFFVGCTPGSCPTETWELSISSKEIAPNSLLKISSASGDREARYTCEPTGLEGLLSYR